MVDIFGTEFTYISVRTQAGLYINSALNPKALGRNVGPVQQIYFGGFFTFLSHI
jgi:hypothetical protein